VSVVLIARVILVNYCCFVVVAGIAVDVGAFVDSSSGGICGSRCFLHTLYHT
jgi:hypothetical protein